MYRNHDTGMVEVKNRMVNIPRKPAVSHIPDERSPIIETQPYLT